MRGLNTLHPSFHFDEVSSIPLLQCLINSRLNLDRDRSIMTRILKRNLMKTYFTRLYFYHLYVICLYIQKEGDIKVPFHCNVNEWDTFDLNEGDPMSVWE